MKIELKPFQDVAVAALYRFVRGAARDVLEGDAQAVILASPTGSGKTVIANALMETIVRGDGDHEGDPAATFLWLSDSPKLNEQTRDKFVLNSEVFGKSDLVTVASTFDQRVFAPGKVHFLNVQKLGRERDLVERGDSRSFTIWETVANTIDEAPGSFWLVIDEAHRGTEERRGDRELAATIMQRFIKGSEEVPAVPLVLGISATPERFVRLVDTRQTRPLAVSPADVRESGLLKDIITLFHATEAQPSNWTLLHAAAERLLQFEESWSEYTTAEGLRPVRPILVVQVEDAAAGRASATELDQALEILQDALGTLTESQVAHSFQEEAAVPAGETSLRYLAPQAIQADPDVRVVFFKRSLSTGWDCPRAEVMMSFRRAVDRTVIAQLVGRMVRTPLARRVGSDDFLNTVSLYLPRYDEAGLDAIVEYLTNPDPEDQLPARVERGENRIEYPRNAAVAEAFETANGLPTYVVQRTSTLRNAARLAKLATALASDGIEPGAGERMRGDIVAMLLSERATRANDEPFRRRLAEAQQISMREVEYDMEGTKLSTFDKPLLAVARNLDDAYAEVGRRLGASLHIAYAKARQVQDDASDLDGTKTELYALIDDATAKSVDVKAGELVDASLERHKGAIAGLGDERRDAYRGLRLQADRPTKVEWELNKNIIGPRTGAAWQKHLYADADGIYHDILNAWESAQIEAAVADAEVVGWLRNQPRAPWAFTVPYRHGGRDKPHYPDFIVFRRHGGTILPDVLEPHSLAWEDTVEKARGMAEFAQRHGELFGRIDMLAEIKGRTCRLALNDLATRDAVLKVEGANGLRTLFEAAT
jgi:type III restriction enzyme